MKLQKKKQKSRCKRYLIVLLLLLLQRIKWFDNVNCIHTFTQLPHFVDLYIDLSVWLRLVFLFLSFFTVVRVLLEWARYWYFHTLIFHSGCSELQLHCTAHCKHTHTCYIQARVRERERQVQKKVMWLRSILFSIIHLADTFIYIDQFAHVR